MAWKKDEDELDSEREQARFRKRKRGGALPPQFKKKKAPPFQSKVEGGTARRRADRKAFKRQGGGGVSDEELRRAVANPPKPAISDEDWRAAGAPREPRGGWKPPDKQTTWPADLKRARGGVPASSKDKADLKIPPFETEEEEADAQVSGRTAPRSRRAAPYAAGGDTGGKWIGKARASMERRGTVGSLRKAMGAKEGQKIPTSSLQAKKAQAERTGNTKMMRKVQFALNVRK